MSNEKIHKDLLPDVTGAAYTYLMMGALPA